MASTLTLDPQRETPYARPSKKASSHQLNILRLHIPREALLTGQYALPQIEGGQ